MPEPDAPPSGRRRWLWVAALVVLAGGGLVTWRVLRRPPPLQYQTAAVAKGPVVARVTATGILSAVVTVQVGSQVSGRIAKLNADYNSTVKKGQLIAEIDPALFEANLAQSKANVLAAEGQLKQAEANVLAAKRTYERDKPLRASNLIAQADLDTAETTLQAAQASVVAARGQFERQCRFSRWLPGRLCGLPSGRSDRRAAARASESLCANRVSHAGKPSSGERIHSRV
jgi:HlyD family secretion protein